MERAFFSITLLMMCLSGTCTAHSTCACFLEFFNDELCLSPSVVNVNGADYGVSDCRGGAIGACCPKTSDCQIPVTGEYMQAIIESCNGKQRCASLHAPWTPTLADCGVPGYSDYVTIHYDCLQDGSTLPTTFKPTTMETFSKTLSTGSISAIAAGIIVFLLFHLVIVISVIMKRKGPLNRDIGQPKSKRSENHLDGNEAEGQVAIISGQQLQSEDVSCHNQVSTEDQQPYESLLHQTYTPLILNNTQRSSIESITPTSLGDGCDSHLQSNMSHNSYLEIIEPHQFLSSGSATIPQAYLTVPFSAEGGPPEGQQGDCNSYAEIDKPSNTAHDSYLEIIEPHQFLSSGSATIPQAYLTVPFSAEGGPPEGQQGDCNSYAEIDKPSNTAHDSYLEIIEPHQFLSSSSATIPQAYLTVPFSAKGEPSGGRQGDCHSYAEIDKPSNTAHDSYLEIIEPHQFLSSSSATIPQAYLTVPFSAKGEPSGGRQGDCHSYAEIDKPYNTLMPVPTVQGISHDYLEVGPEAGKDCDEVYETIEGGDFAK